MLSCGNSILFYSTLSVFVLTQYGSATQAQEVDPNIQATVESLTPAPQPSVVEREVTLVPVTREFTTTEIKKVAVKLSSDDRLNIAKKRGLVLGPSIQTFAPVELNAFLDRAGVPRTRTKLVPKRQTKTVTEFVRKSKPRTIEGLVSVPGSYRYESNATKSNSAAVDDRIVSSGAGVTVKIPIGSESDTLAFTASPTLARYDELVGKNADFLTLAANYVTVLRDQPGKLENGADGPKTQDLLAIGLSSSSVFAPGFEERRVVLNKPSITWSRTNVPLLSSICWKKEYCYYGEVSTSGGYTFSDIDVLENAGLELGAKIGWRTPLEGLALISGVKVEGKHYTNDERGREDVITTVSTGIAWKLSPNVSLGGELNYVWQVSSEPELEWDGFTLLPKFVLSANF